MNITAQITARGVYTHNGDQNPDHGVNAGILVDGSRVGRIYLQGHAGQLNVFGDVDEWADDALVEWVKAHSEVDTGSWDELVARLVAAVAVANTELDARHAAEAAATGSTPYDFDCAG